MEVRGVIGRGGKGGGVGDVTQGFRFPGLGR